MPDDWPAVKMEDITALCDAVVKANAERDRYLRALVHIRSNAESILTAHDALARIAGEFQETPEFINARWNYTEANAALTGGADHARRFAIAVARCRR